MKHPLVIGIAVLAVLGIGACLVLSGLVLFSTPGHMETRVRQWGDGGELQLEYQEAVRDGHRLKLTKRYASRRMTSEVWTSDEKPGVEKRAVYRTDGALDPDQSGIYVNGVRTEPWVPAPADYEPFD